MEISKMVRLFFTLFPTPVQVYVRRKPKEAYNLECLVPTVIHGGGSVMNLAALTWYTVGQVAQLV
jgi:hypothetical protein